MSNNTNGPCTSRCDCGPNNDCIGILLLPGGTCQQATESQFVGRTIFYVFILPLVLGITSCFMCCFHFHNKDTLPRMTTVRVWAGCLVVTTVILTFSALGTIQGIKGGTVC